MRIFMRFKRIKYINQYNMSRTRTIKDPLLEPFFIGKDATCYTVYESVAPKKTRAGELLEEGVKGDVYEKPQSYYADLTSALVGLAKLKLDQKSNNFSSVKEYLTEWDRICKALKINFKKYE